MIIQSPLVPRCPTETFRFGYVVVEVIDESIGKGDLDEPWYNGTSDSV